MSFLDCSKKQEFIEKSKCIFGNNTFSYEKLPEKVNTMSSVDLICNKCGTVTTRGYRQHITQFDHFLGCRKCKYKYHNYNPKDSEEEKERKICEIRKQVEQIKEKYKKIRDEEKEEIISNKDIVEQRYKKKLKENDTGTLIDFLKKNGYLIEINFKEDEIYLLAKGIKVYNELYSDESNMIKSH